MTALIAIYKLSTLIYRYSMIESLPDLSQAIVSQLFLSSFISHCLWTINPQLSFCNISSFDINGLITFFLGLLNLYSLDPVSNLFILSLFYFNTSLQDFKLLLLIKIISPVTIMHYGTSCISLITSIYLYHCKSMALFFYRCRVT